MVLDRFELVNLAEERHVLALGAGGAPIYNSDWGLLITQAGQVWVHQKKQGGPLHHQSWLAARGVCSTPVAWSHIARH